MLKFIKRNAAAISIYILITVGIVLGMLHLFPLEAEAKPSKNSEFTFTEVDGASIPFSAHMYVMKDSKGIEYIVIVKASGESSITPRLDYGYEIGDRQLKGVK